MQLIIEKGAIVYHLEFINLSLGDSFAKSIPLLIQLTRVCILLFINHQGLLTYT